MTKINAKQDNMEQVMLNLNKIGAVFDDISEKLLQLKDDPFVGEGITKLKKNVDTLDEKNQGMNQGVYKGTESLGECELMNEKVFDNIEIPKELSKVYSPTDSGTESINVEKNSDGKSVSEGDKTNLQDGLNIEVKEEKKELGNVLNKEDSSVNTNDEHSIEKEKLEDMSNIDGSNIVVDNEYTDNDDTLGSVLNAENSDSVTHKSSDTEKQVLGSVNTNENIDQNFVSSSFSNNSNNNNQMFSFNGNTSSTYSSSNDDKEDSSKEKDDLVIEEDKDEEKIYYDDFYEQLEGENDEF